MVSTRSPSGLAKSGMRGRLPVETRMASASISSECTSPSGPIVSATTVWVPLRRPVPSMMRTPWLSRSWRPDGGEASDDAADAPAEQAEVDLG